MNLVNVNNDTAVVIGAGFAGTLSAAALAPHFDRVILIERDGLDYVQGVRKGTPQSAHVHVLLEHGLSICENFLPGTRAALLQAGGVPLRPGWDERIFDDDEWLPKRDFGVENISQSRPVLEDALRGQLTQFNNIDIRDRTSLATITSSNDGALSEENRF